MNRTLITIIVGVLLLGGLMYVARPNAQIAAVGITEGNTYDFGTISMAAGKVTNDFKLTNDSAAPINIRQIYTSCMCTVASLLLDDKRFGPFGMPGHGGLSSVDQILSPGEKATIEVTFDPAAHGPAGIGRMERQVVLEDQNGKTIAQYQITATVTP